MAELLLSITLETLPSQVVKQYINVSHSVFHS